MSVKLVLGYKLELGADWGKLAMDVLKFPGKKLVVSSVMDVSKVILVIESTVWLTKSKTSSGFCCASTGMVKNSIRMNRKRFNFMEN